MSVVQSTWHFPADPSPHAMTPVRFLEEARDEFFEQISYYDEHQKALGDRFRESVEAVTALAAAHSKLGLPWKLYTRRVSPRIPINSHSLRGHMLGTHEGGCLCGAIRFRTDGAPFKTAVCHCKLCQRTTGSAFSIELLFSKKALTFQGATPSEYTYRSPDHGRLLHYLFCPTCGTRLGVTLERFPAIQIIYAGTYDDPTWVQPDSHIFMQSAVPWIAPPSGADCFNAHMLSEDGSPIQPMPRLPTR